MPNSDARKRYYERHKRLGLCVQCSRKAATGLFSCRVCLEKETVRMTRMKLDIFTWMVALAFFAFAIVPAFADEYTNVNPTELVDKSIITLTHFVADPSQHMFRKYLKESKGIFIMPMLVKGGFIFGASIGNGVLLGRDKTGEWSYPAFYTLGSFNFGPQVGVEVAEVVMLLRNTSDVVSLLATKVKLGADISVAAGIGGGGVAVKTANILVFTRTKGAFVGLTLEVAFFQPRNEWNQKYYGNPTLPEDIMIRRNVSSDHADALLFYLGLVFAREEE